MYLAKILFIGIFLFVLGVSLNIATLVTVINNARKDAQQSQPASNVAENLKH